MTRVCVIDYGMGNLASVCRAFEHLGADTVLSADHTELERADALVLPGVGAFGDGMAALHERGLVDVIRRLAAAGKPLLGICLGAQMLFDQSEEFGEHQGLGLIPGRIRHIPTQGANGERIKVPHMGWADLAPEAGAGQPGSLLRDTPAGSAVYFVHSLHAVPINEADRIASCNHAGNRLTAAVRLGNIHGCQFHPEKSGPVGLHILKNYLEAAA